MKFETKGIEHKLKGKYGAASSAPSITTVFEKIFGLFKLDSNGYLIVVV